MVLNVSSAKWWPFSLGLNVLNISVDTVRFAWKRIDTFQASWLHHSIYHMMTSSNGNISALLALCEGNAPVTGGFPSQMPVRRILDVFLSAPEQTLIKQSRRRRLKTSPSSSWRYGNDLTGILHLIFWFRLDKQLICLFLIPSDDKKNIIFAIIINLLIIHLEWEERRCNVLLLLLLLLLLFSLKEVWIFSSYSHTRAFFVFPKIINFSVTPFKSDEPFFNTRTHNPRWGLVSVVFWGVLVYRICANFWRHEKQASNRKIYVVRMKTLHRFELDSPNLHQTCIIGHYQLLLKNGGHWHWSSCWPFWLKILGNCPCINL